MTSNDPAGDETRRTSVLCTEGVATGVVWASRMVESRRDPTPASLAPKGW